MSCKLKGVSAAPGIAIAPLVHFHGTLDYIPIWRVLPEDVEREKKRIHEAMDEVSRSIASLRLELSSALSTQDARIYDAQVSILHDPSFRADLAREIELEAVNGEVALQRVIARYEKVFDAMPDPSMRERSADLRDIGRQVIGALMARERVAYTSDGKDYLFAADEFLPGDAGLLDREHIRGIVTAQGGKYSHGAILARSLGIPAVVGVEDVLVKASSGTTAVLDGDNGVVIVDPSAEELAQYQIRLREQRSVERHIFEIRFAKPVTVDGTEIHLLANVEGVRDLDNLETDAISGIGLFRTEFAFMERREFPSEDEQVAMYEKAVIGAKGKPVTFRTLDFGGDKPLGYFRTPDERNPVLGWRGLRICLDWPDILYTQMRAILRASALGPVRVLLPMVTSKEEVDRCRGVLDDLLTDLRRAGIPHDRDIKLGVMVEVPISVPVLPEILRIVDFLSVGTNDLVQYLLAVDRDNARVARLYDPFHPGVLRVLRQIASHTEKAKKPGSICGEIAGDHWFTPILLGLGFRHLSMAPTFLPRVKLMVRSFGLPECRSIAQQVLAAESSTAVRRIVKERIRSRWEKSLGEQTDGKRA
ncbi:MAG: phosphoenolpyruvate--protein phosphotransferase [Planctomycetota bacterium]